MIRQSLLIAILAFVTMGVAHAAKAPPYDPFKTPQPDFYTKIKTIALAPVSGVSEDLENHEQVVAKFEEYINNKLRQAGFSVVASDEYAKILKRMTEQVGGYFDPVTGKRDEAKLKSALEHTRRELATSVNADAVLFPHFVVVKANFAGGRVSWDGTWESVLTEKKGWKKFFDTSASSYGTVGALSLAITIENIHGTVLYFNRGGVKSLLKLSNNQFVEVSPGQVLDDEWRNASAVKIALDPLVMSSWQYGERAAQKRADAATETASGSYRIAIFPGGGQFGWSADAGAEERVARVLQAYIQRDNALVLRYSYYDDVLNEPRIRKPDRLWVGGAVQKKPNLELVFTLAQERDIDGVVMYWGVVSGTSFASATANPIWVYLIDIERRQVYHRKGTTKKGDVDKLTRKLVAQFLADRPHVVLAKATPSEPTTVTPTAVPTKEVVTPTPTKEDQQASGSARYRIGVFPCGGNFGEGYQGALEERVARVLQTSIQRNRALTLVYSYYDDVLSEPRIKNRDRLWVGGQVRKRPNAEVVYGLARERELDGVVTCWGHSLPSSYYTESPQLMWVYLIDVAERKVYRKKGTTKKSDVDKLTRNVVAQFLADRPQVTQTKAEKPTNQ